MGLAFGDSFYEDFPYGFYDDTDSDTAEGCDFDNADSCYDYFFCDDENNNFYTPSDEGSTPSVDETTSLVVFVLFVIICGVYVSVKAVKNRRINKGN